MTKDELIAALEGAETGSRELSDEVLRACGWYHRVDKRLPDRSQWGWLKRDSWDEKAVLILGDPSPAESIDAALTLVKPQDGSNLAGFLHAVTYQQSIGDIPDDKIAIAICLRVLRSHD